MPASRKRGGKKAHNKRVNARNQRIQGTQKKMNEAYQKLFKQKMDEIQNSLSTQTETEQLDPKQVAETLSVQLPNPVSKQD
jgi:Skp family chaperone for outer membrane proteins